MISVGFMGKLISPCPEWILKDSVQSVYSVSNCISSDFCEESGYNLRNHYWFFDSPQIIMSLSKAESISLGLLALLYYELYPKQYDMGWQDLNEYMNITSQIAKPLGPSLLGYDVVSTSVGVVPECSPLSCNSLANELPVNKYCLFDTLSDAITSLENGEFDDSEPGPYKIFSVYSTQWPS